MERQQALEALKAQNPEPFLVQHGLYTESIMQSLAKHFGEEPHIWGLIGLLHDIDYPLTKDNHALHGMEAAKLVPPFPAEDHEKALHAIAAHNWECTGIEPKSTLDFALRAAESVTGLISAAALVRPEGMKDMQAKSLKKKMKDKSFAASVDRERIKECEKINIDLDSFLTLSIKAMEEMPQA